MIQSDHLEMNTQTTLSMVEKISAVTLRVANMEASVRFYKDVNQKGRI